MCHRLYLFNLLYLGQGGIQQQKLMEMPKYLGTTCWMPSPMALFDGGCNCASIDTFFGCISRSFLFIYSFFTPQWQGGFSSCLANLLTISKLKKEAKGKGAPMSNDDIIKIETRKQELKVEASRAAAMAREEVKDYGQHWKQERTDQQFQQKLNGVGMAQMLGKGGSW